MTKQTNKNIQIKSDDDDEEEEAPHSIIARGPKNSCSATLWTQSHRSTEP